MSVQAGIWNFDGEPVSRESLMKISQATAEYGPDGETIHIDTNIGMLYRPFHTTAESRLERQPYLVGTCQMITWDGRLDNQDELIPELQNDLGPDHTDIAIVAAVFLKWGVKGFSRLIGDWALAILDPRHKELILARDYIGARHLFYFPTPNGVSWCSHLAPLALSGKRLTISDEYVAGYLGFQPDAHLTPYRQILSVPPGKWVRISDSKTTIQPYWAFNFRTKTRFRTDTEYEEQFRILFRWAVRRRLRADGPVLMQLSGGWDSSSLVCIADDILLRGEAETPRVDTFS
jgi:asparagine synthase (glutamine-hydrolysing)